jgi:solute carrier family 25 protein 16
MLAGSIAGELHHPPSSQRDPTTTTGVSVMPITYPLELVRVRMAIETQKTKSRPSVWSAFRAIYNEPPVPSIPFRFLHFYRGFAVSFLGTVPYRGGIFLVWETLNSHSRDWLSEEFCAKNRHKIHLVIGAVAGTSSQIATYPLEVIRRMQQANKTFSPRGFMGFREAIGIIWRTGGWKGFYAGLGIGLVKQVPMHSISLAVWQASKKWLDV